MKKLNGHVGIAVGFAGGFIVGLLTSEAYRWRMEQEQRKLKDCIPWTTTTRVLDGTVQMVDRWGASY